MPRDLYIVYLVTGYLDDLPFTYMTGLKWLSDKCFIVIQSMVLFRKTVNLMY